MANNTVNYLLRRVLSGRRGICILIIICIVCISDSVMAKTDEKKELKERIEELIKSIEKTEKESDKIKKELEEKGKEKENTLKKLSHFERNIEVQKHQIRKIENEEKRLKLKISSSQKSLKKAEQQLVIHSDEYTQRLRSMYKRQRISPLKMVFSTGSISTMFRGFKMMSVLAKNDIRMLKSVRSQRQTIKSEITTIRTSLKAQQSLAKAEKRKKISLEKDRTTRANLLEEIKRDEKLLEERQRQILEKMEEFQAEREKYSREFDKKADKLDISDNTKNYNFGGQKGKLSWPVNGKVISKFGFITDPKTKTRTINRGIEIETQRGEPVSAIGSGVVVMSQFRPGYGNFVWIYHYGDYHTIYAHLSDFFVNEDEEVLEGDIIGLVGSTGLIDDSVAKLLLEILNGKNPENPLNWLKPQKKRS